MLLKNKTAVLYGGRPVGAALARAFAEEGARVFIARRNESLLNETKNTIALRSAGFPDTLGVHEVFYLHVANAGITCEQFDKEFAERIMLKRLPMLLC